MMFVILLVGVVTAAVLGFMAGRLYEVKTLDYGMVSRSLLFQKLALAKHLHEQGAITKPEYERLVGVLTKEAAAGSPPRRKSVI